MGYTYIAGDVKWIFWSADESIHQVIELREHGLNKVTERLTLNPTVLDLLQSKKDDNSLEKFL